MTTFTRTIPRFIGIAGPSCAGKSILATAVAAKLPDSQILAMDRYYHDLAHLPIAERARQNFDHPDALDWARLLGDIAILASGRSAALPVYDFAAHARSPKSDACPAAPLIIVEGIFALVSPELRQRFTLSVYVDIPRDTLRERRVARDVIARGRTAASIVEQLQCSVEPMMEQHLAPTRTFADLVVEGSRPLDELVEAVVGALASRTA